MSEPVAARMRREALLAQATAARQGLDRWRAVGPVLRELREAEVSFGEIERATGIPRGTAARMCRTPGKRSSEATQ
jgi:hypothetical protein